MRRDELIAANIRGAIYAPPNAPLPYIAVVFGADESILLSRPFATSVHAQAYLDDLVTSLGEIDSPVAMIPPSAAANKAPKAAREYSPF